MSNDVRRMMTTPLSDSDLKKILGDDIKIIIYSSLSSVSNLRDILTKDRDCMVILHEQKKVIRSLDLSNQRGRYFYIL